MNGAGRDEEGASSRKVVFFSLADAPALADTGMMQPVVIDAEITETLDLSPMRAGSCPRVLFRQDDGAGHVSLVHAWFGPDYPLPRHSHSVDCLYYVVAGQVLMGSRTLGPGEGFFVPSGRPYGYKAGPEGAQVLEFRSESSFDIVFRDNDRTSWSARLEIARAHADEWSQARPNVV